MDGLEKTDFYDLVERIKDSFMEIDSDIMVDLKKQGTWRDGKQISVYSGSDGGERSHQPYCRGT